MALTLDEIQALTKDYWYPGANKNYLALLNVLEEREKQEIKWGEQNHNPYKWLVILGKEVGEASKALLEEKEINYRDEMVQVAAVALAAIESFDRKKITAGG